MISVVEIVFEHEIINILLHQFIFLKKVSIPQLFRERVRVRELPRPVARTALSGLRIIDH